MKILVATNKSQGQRANDFSWVPPGEIVYLSSPCGTDDGPDGSCGCMRSMAGVKSHRATTTFAVKDVKMTLPQYAQALSFGLASAGWDPAEGPAMAKFLSTVAAKHKVGTVLERRGPRTFRARVVKK